MRTPPLPTSPSRFAARHVHVIDVADLANRRVTVLVNAPDLARRQFHQRVTAFAVVQCRLLACAPRNLAAASRGHLNIVNVGAQRNGATTASAFPRSGATLSPAITCRADPQVHPAPECNSVRRRGYLIRAMRAERFGSYSIPITSAATPRLRRLKSTLRYFCLWPPPMWRDVSRPMLLRPPVLFFGSNKRFLGLVLRDFIESRERLEPQRRSKWAKIFKCHNRSSLDEIDLLAFFQRHDRFFPMRPASEIGAAFPLLFPGVIAGVHIDHLLLKQTSRSPA